MEQEIRFCTTSDGVRIAYATLGQGPPLVYACGWPGHLEVEWEKPFVRAFLQTLGRGSTLIRYDMRGSGLSDRDVSDFSLTALSKDLQAVAEHLSLERFALLSLGLLAGPIAITYAAANPERLSRLILYSGFLRFGQTIPADRRRALIEYVRLFGFPHFSVIDTKGIEADQQRGVRDIQEAAVSPATQAALLETLYALDVSDEVGRLSIPVLVMHARGDPLVPFSLGRDLAIRLPQARFVPFEGSSAAPWAVGDILLSEIHRFIGVEAQAPAPKPAVAAGLVTILFTDIEGSTTLTQRLGDAKAQDVLRAHNAVVREALDAHGGSQVKHTGDGIMASFPSASRAIECAIAIQRALTQPNPTLSLQGRGSGEGAQIRVRIGLNAGEPVAEEEDLFGTAVQVAARICARAEPEQILCSNVVRELAAGKGFLFSDQGDVVLRGFEDPVRLYEVRWQQAEEA